MRIKTITAAALAASTFALVGCASAEESNRKRIDFLNEVARIGAQTHASVAKPDGTVDEAVCKEAFKGRITEIPAVSTTDRKAWAAEIERTFVAACMSGQANEVKVGG